MSTATDSFNRANVSPLAAPWTEQTTGNGFILTSNTAQYRNSGTDCAAAYNGAGAPTWGNDQSSSVAVTCTDTTGGGVGIGPSVRHAASGTNTLYRVVVGSAATNNCQLGKVVAGSFTNISQFTQAFSTGDRWEQRAIGTTLTTYLNGTLVKTATDSSITSGSPGLSYSSAVSVASSVDDWIATDVFTGSPPIVFQAVPFYSNPLTMRY